MRHVRDILRLKHHNQLSVREVARSCGLPVSTVGDYLQRAEASGLAWPLPEGLADSELQAKLLASGANGPAPIRELPPWPQVHEQLRRKGVTLHLLWQEYRQAHPDGFQYSRFCELYREWADTLEPVMRLPHEPGQKLFVDWAGQTVPIQQPDGTTKDASIFVAVLGFSNRTYAEAFANQQLPSWIAGHSRAFSFFGGVTRSVVPDNPKTAVIYASRYEPELHSTYQAMAAHYGTAVIPARPKAPRDKAKVENGVLIVERQILAALRDQRFFSVGELNQSIRPLLDKLNAQPFQKLEGSRNSWFDTQEKDKLLPLPDHPFEFATWGKAKVNIDYHVAVDNHFYSVPYSLIHRQLDVRLTEQTVELFYDGKRVAAHPRSRFPGKFTTLDEHRPKSHQRYLEWTPSRIVEWARKIGPQCGQVVEYILAHKPHPEMGFRSCLGIIRLGKGAGEQRLEAACGRALRFGTCSYQSIKSILESGLDRQAEELELPLPTAAHENVRGHDYYS
jgi:transposase